MTIQDEMRGDLAYTPFTRHKTRARIAAHEERLKIGDMPEAVETRKVVKQFWRSGGGCIRPEAGRSTLVSRIVDSEFCGFGGTSRYGNAIE